MNVNILCPFGENSCLKVSSWRLFLRRVLRENTYICAASFIPVCVRMREKQTEGEGYLKMPFKITEVLDIRVRMA